MAAVAVGGPVGCTFLLDPERHDNVARCDFDDDCPLAEDPRYELFCTVSEPYQDQEIDFPRICAPRPAVSCDPREYDYSSTVATRYRDATSQIGRYAEHCGHHPGVQGCVPGDTSCQMNLTLHEESQRCDDTDPDTPPALAAEPPVAGQDVLDQFCRSVYCDIDFVCRTRDFRCVPCELGERLGGGGCGDLYFEGERSTAYQTAQELVDECGGPEMDPADAYVGPVEGDDDIVRRD